MAVGLGETFRSNVLNYIMAGGTAPGRVVNYFISLHTGDPGNDAGTTAANNEITTSGTGYARQTLVSATGWTAATTADPNVLANSGVIAFPTATANYGSTTNPAITNTTHFGVWTSSTLTTAAAYVGRGTINTQSIVTGNTPTFAIGALQLSINTVTSGSTTGMGQVFRKNLYDYLLASGNAGGTDPLSGITSLYASLHTGDPGLNGASNEASGGGYTRAIFPRVTTPAFGSATLASPSVITNSVAAIPFPAATSGGYSTGTAMTFFGVFKNISGVTTADYVLKGTITSQSIVSGNTPSFATSTLTTRLDQT